MEAILEDGALIRLLWNIQYLSGLCAYTAVLAGREAITIVSRRWVGALTIYSSVAGCGSLARSLGDRWNP